MTESGAVARGEASLPGEPVLRSRTPKSIKAGGICLSGCAKGMLVVPAPKAARSGLLIGATCIFWDQQTGYLNLQSLGSPTGLAPFPLGKTLGADSRQRARCNSRSSRTARGICKDPAGRKLVLGEKKAVVITEIPMHTCRHAEVALTGP